MASMMAESRPLPTEGPSAGGSEFDDLDDLFNYDVGDENDPFSDNYKLPNKAEPTKEVTTKTGKNDTGLGIDEEVEVSKKMRVPRVKLDEHRYFFVTELL
jgi:replication fork protection complex subunit Csm3/Swi3